MGIEDRDWYREAQGANNASSKKSADWYDPKLFRRPKSSEDSLYPSGESQIEPGPVLNIRAVLFWMLALSGVFLLALAFTGKSAVTVNGDSLRVKADQTGHFRIRGAVGQRQLNFLLDTGASWVALPDAMRGPLGIVGCESITISKTANGEVRGCATTLKAVDIEIFRLSNVKAVFLPSLDEPLLGMNAIGRFRTSQQLGVLSMTPITGAEVWLIAPRVSPTESWPFYGGLVVLAITGILGYLWFRRPATFVVEKSMKTTSGSTLRRTPYDQLLWACGGDQQRADRLIEKFPFADKQRASEMALKDIWR